jgi:hypothetical protein
MYQIVRFFCDHPCGTRRRTIVRGLTLVEAQAHCKASETSSKTAKSAARQRYTRRVGQWFDGYEESR